MIDKLEPLASLLRFQSKFKPEPIYSTKCTLWGKNKFDKPPVFFLCQKRDSNFEENTFFFAPIRSQPAPRKQNTKNKLHHLEPLELSRLAH